MFILIKLQLCMNDNKYFMFKLVIIPKIKNGAETNTYKITYV